MLLLGQEFKFSKQLNGAFMICFRRKLLQMM